MLNQLFNSATRVKLLSLFFDKKDKEFYVQEIIRLTKTDPANTLRELRKLETLTLLKSRKERRLLFYSLNIKSTYYWGLKELFTAYKKQLTEDKWFIMEDMPNYYPLFVTSTWRVHQANKFFKEQGFKTRFSKLMVIYQNNICSLCALYGEFHKFGKEIIDRVVKNTDWGFGYISQIKNQQNKIIREITKLKKLNLGSYTNKQLSILFNKNFSLYSQLHNFHWIQSCIDLGDNLFSKHLMEYLKLKINTKNYSLGDVFSILTTPVELSNNDLEYNDLLKILSYIFKRNRLKQYFKKTEPRLILDSLSGLDKKLDRLIDEHTNKYGWLGYGVIGPGWKKEYFIDILCSLIRQNNNPNALIRKFKNDKLNLATKQKKLFNELKIDSHYQAIFKLAQQLVYMKGSRKDTMFYYLSVIDFLYKEIGRRFYLSPQQIHYLYPKEMMRLLISGKFDASQLNERYKLHIHYSLGDYPDDLITEGDRAEQLIKSLEFIKEDLSEINVLQGDCACSGRVRGMVSIINHTDDMTKIKKGGVLVSTATNPDLVPAIKIAAAIITDVGGITCHAAIISRELNIPCVIGTKVATRVLKDGDIVDVDATHGKVTMIKKKK